MFRKVLAANRGEVAVRAVRAAYEMGAGTMAVFPWEDRNSVHRLKADESYQVGEVGHPVRAHLSTRTPSTPGTGSCRRPRSWPKPARGRGSGSWGRRRRCWS
jgi:Biotin carboxylase, N-terminal domain